MMDINILSEAKDPMGAAIAEYQKTGKAGRLRVLSTMFDEDEIPVKHLFRTFDQMPEAEQMALSLAKGDVLDVGAGAGCHALYLQEKGFNVTAIDISPLSCEAMKEQGLNDVQCINLFDRRLTGPFDTILLLMNGTGIIGKLKNMPEFFTRMRELLTPDGQILVDSSDLKYLYENEDGTYDIDPLGPYYGEVDYQMAYRKIKGDNFDWLYVDPETLKLLAKANGMKCETVLEGEHFDYLAKITL